MESPSSSLEEQEDEEEEEEEETILSRQTSVSLVPFVGQRFVSQEAAYEFYCGFAKQRGFSIRRHRTRGKDGVGRGITRRDFTCHRAGFPQTKPNFHHDFAGAAAGAVAGTRSQIKRNRKSTRCGCQAYMRIVKRSTEPDNVPEWRVTGFGDSHNHEMMPRPGGGGGGGEAAHHRLLVPSSDRCAVSADDKARICVFAKAGMSVRQMLRLMELEKGVKLGCLPFTEVDVRNLLQSFRTVEKDSDPIDLIAMCKAMKDDDQSFKYEFKIDGCNRLECIAWSYGASLRSYGSFGDAVVFDTTHRIEGHDMLLGVFLGLDNHGEACFFGCVLLRDENMLSFSWALKTFLEFVNGKAPQSISTDQNTWLKEAIANEMPQTKHAFSVWHIAAKFSNWFSVPLGTRYDEWRSEFHRLHGLDSPEDFDRGWSEMINEFGLRANRHIVSLYALRSFWAFAFLKQFFFAGITSAFHAESISAFVQRISGAQSQLHRFVHHLSDIVEYKDRAGSKYPKVCLKTGSPIESHAAAVLTPYAFAKLQEEIVLAPQYASVLSGNGCFQVRHHSKIEGECQVAWVPHEEQLSCSCGRFEFSGIPCRHVLRVLSTNNCFHVPLHYLPPRWRQDSSPSSLAQKVNLLESMASSLVSESMETEERLDSALEHLSAALARAKDLSRQEYNDNTTNNHSNSDSLILEEDSDGIVRFAIDSLSSPGSKRRLEIQRKRTRICFDTSNLIGEEDVLGYL